MSNSDLVLEYLEEKSPEFYCDDCLSAQLEIKPRQQINQLCSRLNADGKIDRRRSNCSLCKKIKKVNSFRPGRNGVDRLLLPALISDSVRIEPRALYSLERLSTKSPEFDIEKIRTKIVHMCYALSSRIKDRPSSGISKLIAFLREKDILPSHQANMMLTLCNLRNVYVYDRMVLGHRELVIAKTAWEIIQDWWGDRPI